MVSVAMTTFNGEKYLYNQLQSIYCQTYLPDEVIICDDGSTDKTVNVIREFIIKNKIKNCRLICNEKNLGYSKNFFKAVSLCKGNFIFLADQDDIWEKEKVECMINIMKSDESIYALSSNYSIIDAKGNLYGKKTLTSSPLEFSVENIVGCSNIKGCTMCIRKELDMFLVHDDIQVGLQLGHDWYYNFLACLLGKNIIIPNYLLCYRIHGENISLQRSERKMVLALTKDKRIDIFNEIISSAENVLFRYEAKKKIPDIKKKKAKKIISFTKLRKEFVSGEYIKLFSLLLNLGNYRVISTNWKEALHALVSDFMYAFGINWKIR